jgi:hypothetical protein
VHEQTEHNGIPYQAEATVDFELPGSRSPEQPEPPELYIDHAILYHGSHVPGTKTFDLDKTEDATRQARDALGWPVQPRTTPESATTPKEPKPPPSRPPPPPGPATEAHAASASSNSATATGQNGSQKKITIFLFFVFLCLLVGMAVWAAVVLA